jgi:hypothetical protein
MWYLKALIHRYYMGYWPKKPVSIKKAIRRAKRSDDVITARFSGGVLVLDEMNIIPSRMKNYIEPDMLAQIDRTIEKILG